MADTVVLVTVDSLRADRVGVTTPSHRPERELTPHLDEFAASATTCTRAFATGSGTRLSFPGILTSTPPMAYGGYNRLSEQRPSLAQRFRDAGYRTGAVHSNAQLSAEFGYDRGFDSFVDHPGRRGSVHGPEADTERFDPEAGHPTESTASDAGPWRSPTAALRNAVGQFLHEYPMAYRLSKDVDTLLNGFTRPYATAAETRTLAMEWLRGQSGPAFLWVHFMDTHVPYFPPPIYRREFGSGRLSDLRIADLWYKLNGTSDRIDGDDLATLERLYDATVRYFDDQFGALLKDLSEMGRGDATVVFTSDHGDEFREHGGLTHSPQLYNELVHVPLVIDGPTPPGTLEAPVSLLDVAPTLSGAVGGECDGFWGLDLGETTPDHDRRVFSEVCNDPEAEREAIGFDKRIIACRTSRWTYIEDHLRGRTALFDRDTDPDEIEDCLADRPEVGDALAEAVADHWDRVSETSPELLERSMSDDVSRRLQDLGYL